MTRRSDKEDYLTKIPVLGYIFRKIKENRKAIETALGTEEKVEGEVRRKGFFGGLIRIISYRTFNTLELKRKNSGRKNGKTKKEERKQRRHR